MRMHRSELKQGGIYQDSPYVPSVGSAMVGYQLHAS